MPKLLLVLTFLAAPSIVFAAQIDMTTYYDTPDGDFRLFTTTGDTPLSGNVLIGVGGGTTSIGTTAGSPRTLTVKGDSGGAISTASFMNNQRIGVAIGAPSGANRGEIAGKGLNNAEAPLYLNSQLGGTVMVGNSAGQPSANAQLQVTGTFGITQGGNTGGLNVVLAEDAGGANRGYYATYGP